MVRPSKPGGHKIFLTVSAVPGVCPERDIGIACRKDQGNGKVNVRHSHLTNAPIAKVQRQRGGCVLALLGLHLQLPPAMAFHHFLLPCLFRTLFSGCLQSQTFFCWLPAMKNSMLSQLLAYRRSKTSV